MFSSPFSGYLRESSPQECGNTTQVKVGHFTSSEAQDILDAAQLETGRLYANIPDLCEPLQSELRQALEDCNQKDVDPMRILHEQMRIEWRFLDAYNKHRLGRAAHQYYKIGSERNDTVQYDGARNIPDRLEYFPLRSKVSQRGIDICAPPIYQFVPVHYEERARDPITPVRNISKQTPVSSIANNSSSTKKPQGRAADNYDKLADAPSSQLDFPQGNITLAELTCFLPQSIKSWDIIDRLLHNSTFTVTLTDMINHFRIMPNGPITNNTVYRMMKGPMDRRAEKESKYKGWSVAKHQSLEKPEGFNPSSVSVAGFRKPINNYKGELRLLLQHSAPKVLFRDLVIGVRIMPTGYDALDLTRCVRYSLAHPDEDWYYPRDFVELVAQLPQDPHLSAYPKGPAPVHSRHHDNYIANKYTSARKRKGVKQNYSHPRDSGGRLIKRAKNISEDDGNDTDSQSDDNFDEYHELGASDKRNKKRTRSVNMNESENEDSPTSFASNKRMKLSGKASLSGSAPVSPEIQQFQGNDAHLKGKEKAPTASRASRRSNLFRGSYNIGAALDIDIDDET